MKKNGHRLAALVLALALLSGCGGSAGAENAAAFQEKAEALRGAALADWVREDLDDAPAGEAGHAVFLSVCGGAERARVYGATGQTLDDAWSAAAKSAETAVRRGGPAPLWVKADLVYLSQTIPSSWLENIGEAFGNGNFRYGLAFDPAYGTALLEAELNTAGIYDYENGGLDLERLNGYLKETGREPLEALPDEYIAFQCAGWFCGEAGDVYQLSPSDPGYGRREMPSVSGDTARALALDGAEYLSRQVGEDGSFGLSTPRHAEALSAMVRGYEIQPDQTLAEGIDKAAEWLLNGTIYAESGQAFVPDGADITLESCALSLIALADCMEASKNEAYLPACEALGAGILTLLDTETGAFTHVLDMETLSRKEAVRSPSWDGMGVTALCRLYGLTNDMLWLWAAQLALDRMIAEDYTQYGDAWTAYALRETTKYEQNKADYFAFALKNVQGNLAGIYEDPASRPEGLELLMASYETYRQMLDAGYSAGGFELDLTLQVIQKKVSSQLDSYLFPEFAMYMDTPVEMLGAFMSRADGLQVSVETVSRNVLGYAMYAKDYDTLLADGLPE